MSSEKINFKVQEGITLSARLDTPLSGNIKAYAIFAHCFTCSKDLNAVRNISKGLTDNKIAVLRFDFTGLGESEGEFKETNFSSNVNDLISAFEFMKEKYDTPQLLIGHSLGGAAVLMAASKIKEIKTVVTIGTPADPLHVKQLFNEEFEEIKEKGEATVSIGSRPFKIQKQFIDDLQNHDLKEVLSDLKKALLVMHSPQDEVVGINNASEIYKNAFHPKSFISLDGANHLLTSKGDSVYTGHMIASWAVRYIDLKEEQLRTDLQVVTRTGKKYTTEISTGSHSLVGDEPKSAGGDDLGPNPYDYLLSALGSCTGMTLRMYADRKEWPLEEVLVHLEHSKIHAEDCKDCESEKGKIDIIKRVIDIKGDLSNEQRERLLEIANKCPVHRTLHSEIKVRSSLIEGEG